jgi:hypothetical protein
MIFDKARRIASMRVLLLLALALWWWAGSVFSPWAESLDHRLWLYDTLFYLGFLLGAFVLIDVGFAIARWRAAQSRSIVWIAAWLVGAWIAWVYDATETGLRFKVYVSADALANSATLPYDPPRHRAGHFLIDTVREPVPGQPWLWIGRPFGGGTGTGRALVRSGAQAPTPPPDMQAYRFRAIGGGWWVAERLAAP